MTKKFKEKVRSVFSIFNIIALSIQSILPGFFVLLPSKTFAADQQVGVVDLEYSQQSNEFKLEIESDSNVEYVLSYTDEQTKVVSGIIGTAQSSNGAAATTEYAGTCSADGCVAHTINSGKLELPQANFESDFVLVDGILWLKNNDQATVSSVDLGVTYKAPQNNGVQVTFTRLPENPGNLTIRELTLSDEQVSQIGAYSSVAYDITSDMADGSFEYELQLPLPKGADENSELKYAESVEELTSATAVSTNDVGDGNLVATGLDHFTVFVVVYNTQPTIMPGSYPSLGFQATQTSEFGDHLQLAGSERKAERITVELTNWACENDFTPDGFGGWTPNRGNTDACVTTPGSSYIHPITLNVYGVDNSGSVPVVGSLVLSKTVNATIPFRPSYDVSCTAPAGDVPFGGTWYDSVTASCVHGYNFDVPFDLNGEVLPDQVIVTVAYNTQSYGVAPIGENGPYSSLNVAVGNVSPSVGTNVDPDDVFWNTSTASSYTDGGLAGVGILRQDTNWTGYVPIIKIETASATPPSVPINPSHHNITIPTNNFDFNWDDSTGDSLPITYEFQSSLNPAQSDGVLTTGLWKSGILPTSMIHSSGAPDGTWYWQVRATDSAGNVSAWSEIWNVTLDKTAPTTPQILGFLSPTLACGSITNIHNTTSDWTDSTDLTSGFEKYEYNVDYPIPGGTRGNWTTTFTSSQYSGSLNEGLHIVKVRAKDLAGNYSGWSNVCNITTDWTLPTVDLVFSTPGPSATGFQAVFSENVSEAEAENPANYYLSNWPEAGGSGDLVGDATIIYDSATKTAAITFTNPGWYISPEQLWGVQNIHDLAGNLQQVNAYQEYSTPLVAPVTTDSGIDSAWHNSSVTFNLNCTDVDGSGCKKTYYTTDTSDPTTDSSFGNSVTLTVDSEYTIKYFSVDNAGNTEAIKTAVNTVKIDSTIPASTITTFELPDEGQVETPTFDGLIEGTATDSGSDVDHVLLSISHLNFGADEVDREYWDATSSAWVITPSSFRATGTDTWSYQIAPAERILEGTYVVSSHAVDLAGNVENTYTITIVYDKTIPTVTLTMDPTVPNGRNNWYLTKPTITLTANDNFDVDYIEYQWNSTTGAWTTYTGPITPPAEGQNILYYRSVDTVGNISGTGVKEVKFDKTAPTDGAGNLRVENIGSTTADAKWDKPANSGEIDRFQLTWKHTDGSTRSTSVAGDVFETKLFELFNGDWKLTLESQDAAGNSYSVTEDFTVGGSSSGSSSQGTDQGAVLGATDDLSGGTRRAFNQFQARDQDTEIETEDEDGNEVEDVPETILDAEETGSVLGQSDSACSTWKLYLPLFILLLQTLLAFGFEIASRKASGIKLLIALLISGLMIGAFYFMRDPDCFANGGMMSVLAKWFVPVSLILTFVMRWIASLTVEEN